SDIAVTGDEVQIDVTLPEGTQTITVTVTDRAQSQAEAEASFVVDLTAPAAIELAGAVTNRRLGTTELVWVAPGDDNTTDFVTNYEVRRSTDPITAENFDAAELIEAFAPNVAPQQEESYTVADLPWEPAQGAVSVTYHIAVRATDDQGNTSALGDNFSVTQGLDEATFKADGSGDSYGFQVHSIGDINNDGRDDFLASELFGERGHIIYGRDDVEALNEPSPTTQILTGDPEDGFGFFGGRAAGLG
ncbi:MAG: hypothetical protein GY773_09240, partial [Actinomycetia bacterium]|nr:hypothetical protein [Actinomycetes bacterium]